MLHKSTCMQQAVCRSNPSLAAGYTSFVILFRFVSDLDDRSKRTINWWSACRYHWEHISLLSSYLLSKNIKNVNRKDYNFACFTWARNVIFNIKERTQVEGVRKQGAEYNRAEVTADWRTMHDEELSELWRSPNIIGEMGGACCTYGGENKCKYGFVVKPVGNRPRPRPSGRWEDTIKMYLKETGHECVDWINVAQEWRPDVNRVKNLWVPC